MEICSENKEVKPDVDELIFGEEFHVHSTK